MYWDLLDDIAFRLQAIQIESLYFSCEVFAIEMNEVPTKLC